MKARLNQPVLFVTVLVLGVVFLWSGTARAQDDSSWDWPQEIQSGEAIITMYQPQLDSWEGNVVESRAAVSVKMTADSAPVFGAVWLSSRFETDSETRMVTFTDIRVPSVRFPETTEEQQQNLAAILEREIPTWNSCCPPSISPTIPRHPKRGSGTIPLRSSCVSSHRC